MLTLELRCLDCNHTFSYLRFVHEKTRATNCPACASVRVKHHLDIWRAYLLAYGDDAPFKNGTYGFGVTFKNCTFSNFDTAIKVKGDAIIGGNNILFKGNNTAIDADGLYLDVNGLVIE